MSSIIPWMQAHLYTTLFGLWLLMNAIGSLPTPRDGSSAFYEWFFKFTSIVGAAIPRLLAVYSPQTLNTLTGQTVKTTVPPNPPITTNGPEPKI